MTETLAPTSHQAGIEVHDLAPDRVEQVPAAARPTASGPIAILGLGYVGLPSALALVGRGQAVLGIDISQDRLGAIRAQRVDLVPEDALRLGESLQGNAFQLSADPAAMATARAIVICVPTPVDDHLVPDLRILEAACRSVVEHAVAGQTIILTSTTYVGSTRQMLAAPLAARGFEVGRDVYVAFSPERIDPGNVAYPQEVVPRVIGGITDECARQAAEIVSEMTRTVHFVSSPETAELTKLYENTFRAVNIALANEIGEISRAFSVDVGEVVAAASTKPYGFMPFHPGTGVGGHCIPCDPHYLLWAARAARVSLPLIEQAMSEIAVRPSRIVEQVVATLSSVGQGIRGARILVVGAAYKRGVEDVRESPALEIMAELINREAIVEYADSLVPAVRLRDGTVLHATIEPAADYDAAVLHVIQPDFDPTWLDACRVIVDPGGLVRRNGLSHAVSNGSRRRG